jgi:hypothetical protein
MSNPSPPPSPIVVNDIIYLFHEKMGCLENEFFKKKTPLPSMIVDYFLKID